MPCYTRGHNYVNTSRTRRTMNMGKDTAAADPLVPPPPAPAAEALQGFALSPSFILISVRVWV